MTQHDYFAACPKGVEQLLARELDNLGGEDVRETVAGVSFRSEPVTAWRACLWSRLANTILQPIAKVDSATAEQLYQGVRNINWGNYLEPGGCLWIQFSGMNDAIRNTRFAEQKIKDAIVDQCREAGIERPSVDRYKASLVVSARLRNDQVILNLNLCGESLHRRGYRTDTVKAPLKENLAAALLLRAEWPAMAERGSALIDPMCGSGTLLIEAAMMAADIAPGLKRAEDPGRWFNFERAQGFDAEAWKGLLAEATRRRTKGLNNALPMICGSDENGSAVRAVGRNLESAGLAGHVKVKQMAVQEFTGKNFNTEKPGLLISNPPYGERLSDEKSLQPLYRHLGDTLKKDFQGWQAAIFTANNRLGKSMGLRAHKIYKLFNGALPSELLLFYVAEKYFVNAAPKVEGNRQEKRTEAAPQVQIKASSLPLSEGARMVANRLQKNLKTLKRWRNRSGVSCFRLYDADLPEYAAAIDVYHNLDDDRDYFHVQEYAPPKSVDPDAAQRRFADLLHALVVTFGVEARQVSIKQRRRNKGSDQYQALTGNPFENMLTVAETDAKFLVNLHAYIDCGLFLDHRPLRRLVRDQAQGKRLLNLFCYTASVTVQAALGGAKSSTSVDMSNTYIDWSRRNFRLNGMDEQKHQLVQADCLEWLDTCKTNFDLIVLDPPSFSNSKRMKGVLDIQRDHVDLVRRCMKLLASEGKLYFSNNLRSFKLNEKELLEFTVKDITVRTIDQDFMRNPGIHGCWEISMR